MVSGAREDKFSATGLTAVRSKVVDAPYVDECPLVLECELQATLELGSHTQFVGRILNVGIESDCLNESGQPDMYRIDPLLYDGGQKQYCRVGEPLAKPFPWPPVRPVTSERPRRPPGRRSTPLRWRTDDKSASKVYFTDMRCPVGTGLLDKLKKLIEKAGIDSIDMDSKFVAIKIHFGEPGNLSFLRPNFAKVVADKVTSLGGRPS